ncbi:MAG: alpha/beta hydrolase [Pseudomonas sp.]|nr:alpha/beta hydrolase [Pseudomonas sp.]
MKAQTETIDNQPFEHLQIDTESGRRICARAFAAKDATSVVIIAGAMGVGQQCYEKFARYLRGQGMTAITFDYFGIGASLHAPLAECDTNLTQWGREDCDAVIRQVREQYPTLPTHWVGHSVGGQLLGMVPRVNQLDRIVTVASGSGYWRRNSPPTKRIAWLLWYALAPLSVGLLGYFPGARLNIVGDLPGGVMRQWRRWCLHPDYVVGAEGDAVRAQFSEVRVPITSVAFTDDEMMSRHNVDSLHSFYHNAPVTMMRLTPADLGEQAIGHLGWFRERYRESVWRGVLLPLLS